MSTNNQTGVGRLQKEYKKLIKNPLHGIDATPSSDDIFTWYYVVTGPVDTPYQNGRYFGRVKFPPTYPYAPPTVHMYTPNGCFSTKDKVCMSMTDMHPETWNPLWGISSILTGLSSFMSTIAPTMLASETTEDEKKYLAKRSMYNNVRNALFRENFPHLIPEEFRSLAAELDARISTREVVEGVEEEMQSTYSPVSAEENNALTEQKPTETLEQELSEEDRMIDDIYSPEDFISGIIGDAGSMEDISSKEDVDGFVGNEPLESVQQNDDVLVLEPENDNENNLNLDSISQRKKPSSTKSNENIPLPNVKAESRSELKKNESHADLEFEASMRKRLAKSHQSRVQDNWLMSGLIISFLLLIIVIGALVCYHAFSSLKHLIFVVAGNYFSTVPEDPSVISP